MLPNVLGIGVQRSGTTWLHNQLAMHPEVCVPDKRKEVHYFDRYYENGINWYKSFFSCDGKGGNVSCIAEITPMYMYDPNVPKRILDTLGSVRFIVILRDPVDRAVSQYRLAKRQFNLREDFREYLEGNPDVLKRGIYTEQLDNYFKLFAPKSFLFLRFEDVTRNPALIFDQLSRFLDISRIGFDEAAGKEVSNEGFSPRLGGLYATGKKLVDYLRDHDMDYAVNFLKRMNVGVLAGRNKNRVKIMPNDLEFLRSYYCTEVDRLEAMLGIDLSNWRQ